jgi:hypothetical protein
MIFGIKSAYSVNSSPIGVPLFETFWSASAIRFSSSFVPLVGCGSVPVSIGVHFETFEQFRKRIFYA